MDADDDVEIDFARVDGSTAVECVRVDAHSFALNGRELVDLGGNVTRLTALRTLRLIGNMMTHWPEAVLALTALQWLNVNNNKLHRMPSQIVNMRSLTHLYVDQNSIRSLPDDIDRLERLEVLSLSHNKLTASGLPRSLGRLRLRTLWLDHNQLEWLPAELDDLPATARVFLSNNRFPVEERGFVNARSRIPEIICSTSHLLVPIRDKAATLAIGLQDLDLPALVTLEIIDAAWENSIPMHKKWDLVVAVKHWLQRRP